MQKLNLPVKTLYVKKTGLPFYDAARLIGIAHLFFGTSGAEVEDLGASWQVSGVLTLRDREQILWALDTLAQKDKKTGKDKGDALTERIKKTQDNLDSVFNDSLSYFSQPEILSLKSSENPLRHMDAAIQKGIRGHDPLCSYSALAPQAGNEFDEEKAEVKAALFGICFAARTFSEGITTQILPVFSGRFVVSSFLDWRRSFKHNAAGIVPQVWAALTILSDLTGKPISIADFAYNKLAGRTLSESGYLGFDQLSRAWQDRNSALCDVKIYLERTAGHKRGRQTLDLTRALAEFIVNPTVEKLELIIRLKARLLAASEGEGSDTRNAASVRDLFARREITKEVGKMATNNSTLPNIPDRLVGALAEALGLTGKGWMNKFIRLENAFSPDRFLAEIERIISRSAYEKPDVYQTYQSETSALMSVYGLNNQDFRAYKAIFLLQVLSRLRLRQESEETTPNAGVANEDKQQS